MFMNDIVDFFNKAFDLFAWGVGIFGLVIAFVVGGFVGNLLRYFVMGIGMANPFKVNRALVDLVLRGLVLLGAAWLCWAGWIPFREVIESILPVGNYEELAEAFGADQSPTFVSGILAVGWKQLVLLMITSLPFFLITQVINLIETLFCPREEESLYGYVSFIPEFLTLVAANVFSLYLARVMAYLLLQFVESIKLQYGIVRWIILVVILFVYLYFVICDMFGSDAFLTMMGANIAAVILNVDPLGGQRTVILLLCIALGYVSKLARTFTIRLAVGSEESERAPTISVLYGIGAIVVVSLLFLGVFKLMGY